MSYVVCLPATPRSGWLCAARDGIVITHHRLENAASYDREAARAAAQLLFPDRHVYVQGDEHKPWERN